MPEPIEPLPPVTEPAAGATSAGLGRLRRMPRVTALVLLLFILLGWQWWDSRNRIADLQQELGKKLADADRLNQESRLVATQSQEAVREMQVKLGILENQLTEFQNQQVALETLYQELSRNRDESALAEIEQVLLLAGQQLQLAGNVKAALIAMEAADTRLQRMNKPQLAPLRKVLIHDIERLKAQPAVDTVGIVARLDNLLAEVDGWPLAMESRPAPQSRPPRKPDAQEAVWRRLAWETWLEFKQLLRIENTGKPDIPLLAPEQGFFLRENLKLRLLSARIAVLARDDTSAKTDLEAARRWMDRYYDGKDKAVAAARETLRRLQESTLSVELPDISASLDAVRQYKLGRDRSGR